MRAKILILAILANLHNLGAETMLNKYLGFGLGFYKYEERNSMDEFVMSMSLARYSLLAGASLEVDRAKYETNAQISYGFGQYDGHTLDTDLNGNDDRKAISSATGALIGDLELKAGYSIFYNESSKLYLQGGAGYFINRMELLTANRIQGYLYLPIEVQALVRLRNNAQLDLLAGWHYFVVGNHFTQASQYGFTKDYYDTQKNGTMLKVHIGLNFDKGEKRQSLRLVYRYFDVPRASGKILTSASTGNSGIVVEPKNFTHMVDLQYVFNF